MDILSQNKLKAGTQSFLITGFWKLKTFDHSSFVYHTYPRLTNFYPRLPIVRGVNQALQASSHPSSAVLVAHLLSYWKPFISLGRWNISAERAGLFFFFLFWFFPLTQTSDPQYTSFPICKHPRVLQGKKINPAKTIKYKFTWSKHRVTGDFSPYLHSTLRPYKWLCKLHQLPELPDKSQCQRDFQERESK